jgi:ABC-type sugar transport system ATPase subunit
MINDIVLSMRHISKSFPWVVVLDNIDFTIRKGEIHALMGENGAGQSTLIKILIGVEEYVQATEQLSNIFIAAQHRIMKVIAGGEERA